MKHAGATALMVLDAQTEQPAGIMTFCWRLEPRFHAPPFIL